MEDVARKKIVQNYYSKRDKDYERQKIRTWKSKQGFGTEIIDRIIGALAGLENKTVLEVGVGSGRIGFSVKEKIKPWFVGLDLSKKMLGLAKTKMPSYKQKFDLILGDAESLPFISGFFDAIVCISTMHYFEFPERCLTEFSRTLKEKSVFIYGDLTLHELDNHGFLDALERTLSEAHAIYCKPSEMKKLLENLGFHVSKVEAFPYRKSFVALMEDKGRYFGVDLETLNELILGATVDDKKTYSVDSDGLTLFYMLITALKENKVV
jgi:ubiquinone/menaquinone biosynthesis C-methylase UbiE